jgi:hypothetical protein
VGKAGNGALQIALRILKTSIKWAENEVKNEANARVSDEILNVQIRLSSAFQ